MITEDYVSFETAKLLKEKGFDEKCLCYYEDNTSYNEGIKFSNWFGKKYSNSEIGRRFSAPTLQMAMKWLLKKYNIFICILFLEESNGFGYTIENIVKKEYITTSKNSSYKEIEDACEAAIKYCLDLI